MGLIGLLFQKKGTLFYLACIFWRGVNYWERNLEKGLMICSSSVSHPSQSTQAFFFPQSGWICAAQRAAPRSVCSLSILLKDHIFLRRQTMFFLCLVSHYILNTFPFSSPVISGGFWVLCFHCFTDSIFLTISGSFYFTSWDWILVFACITAESLMHPHFFSCHTPLKHWIYNQCF